MADVLPFPPAAAKPATPSLIDHAREGGPPAVVFILPAIRMERYADGDCPCDTNPPDDTAA